MALRKTYVKEGFIIAPQYSNIELASGRALITLYAGDIEPLTSYLLSETAFYSHSGVTIQVNDANAIDVDFDLQFLQTVILEGKAIIQLPISRQSNGGATGIDVTITVRLRKWDGTTETEIVSDTFDTSVLGAVGAGLNQYKMITFDLVAPFTVIGQGSYLRFTLEATAIGAGGVSRQITYFHDPKNRTTDLTSATIGQGGTALILLIPIRIDL